MIFNFYAQIIPREFLVDTTYVHIYVYVLHKAAGIFIGVDILVLISEFVVVAILSEWWSVPTTARPLWTHPLCMQY